MHAWYQQQDADDPGMRRRIGSPAFDDNEWKQIQFPVDANANPLPYWHGTMWCRKEVEIPPAWVGKELELHLGAVDEADDTYVNGQHVGRVWFDIPDCYTTQRCYTVPATLVTSTKVVLTVRVIKEGQYLGLDGPAKEMKLLPKKSANVQPVSLTGAWRYVRAAVQKRATSEPAVSSGQHRLRTVDYI